jgi:hypothetical protein
MVVRMNKRLTRGPHASPNQNTVRAQCQRSGKPTPVGNAARSNDQCVRAFMPDQIDDFRHETHRPAPTSVTACLAPLGNNHRGASRKSSADMVKRLTLTDQTNAGVGDRASEWPRVAEGKHQSPGSPLKNLIKKFALPFERPGDEAAAHRRVACCTELLFEPSGIAIAAANQPQPTGVADCRR